MTDSCYLTLDGENIVIQDGEKILGRFPLHTLENVSETFLPNKLPVHKAVIHPHCFLWVLRAYIQPEWVNCFGRLMCGNY